MHSRRSRLNRLRGENRELTDAEIRKKNVETRKKWENALLKKVIKENETEWFGAVAQGPQTKRQMKGGHRRKRLNLGGITTEVKRKKTNEPMDFEVKTKFYSLDEFIKLSPENVADWSETLHFGALRGHRHKFIRSNVSGAILLKFTNRDAALKAIGFGNKHARKMICKALTRMEKYHQKHMKKTELLENPHPHPTRPKQEKVKKEVRNAQGLLVRRQQTFKIEDQEPSPDATEMVKELKKQEREIDKAKEREKLKALANRESKDVHASLLASRQLKVSRKHRRPKVVTSSSSSRSSSRSRSRSWSRKRRRSSRAKFSRRNTSTRRQSRSKSSSRGRCSSSASSQSCDFSC